MHSQVSDKITLYFETYSKNKSKIKSLYPLNICLYIISALRNYLVSLQDHKYT